MAVQHRIQQPFGQVVDVSAWAVDSQFPIGPQGAKPKRILICPDPAPYPYLVAGHRYLFKEPSDPRQQMQIWSEVIAYELARPAQLEVPPAFLGFDAANGRPGVLIEFFFGYQGMLNPSSFEHAIDRFQRRKIAVDPKRGSLRDNVDLTRVQRVADWKSWWLKTLMFDAVLGNTDRHAENWGFMTASNGAGGVVNTMAPIFDNGTSLGWGIEDRHILAFLAGPKFQPYLENGRHHFSWQPGDNPEAARHAALCKKYLQTFNNTGVGPTGKALIQSLSDASISAIITWCSGFNYQVPFSALRGRLVEALIKGKRDVLVREIGGLL